MQGTIAQLLSLAAHGNKFLTGNLQDGYFPNSSTFRFCKSVTFVDVQNTGKKWHEKEFSANPIEWFQKLKDTGVMQLRVCYLSTNNEQMSDRMSVAFVGGGGRWFIETVKPSASDFWEAKWEIGDRNDPDQNIWRVKYGRSLKNTHRPEPSLPSAAEVKNELASVLQKISKFAHENGHSNFGECFDRGLQALTELTAHHATGYSIFPEDYAPIEHQQLLNASQSAWVFGGMGSWNDIWFSNNEAYAKYEELSDQLFKTINLALIVASNPFPRPTQEPNITSDKINKKWWQFWKKS